MKNITYNEYVEAISVISRYLIQRANNEAELLKSEIFKSTYIDLKLTDTDLSVRALNCLKCWSLAKLDESGENYIVYTKPIYTIGDLLNFTRNDLLKMRNMGRKSVREIELMLQKKGLRLSTDNSSIRKMYNN